MKTIIVAGAAGFIGSHLSERLLKENNHVIGIDNLVTGSEKNITHLSSYPDFLFLNQNISQPFEIQEQVDEIYNFACPASPVDFKKLGVQIGEVSSLGTYNLLQIARQYNARYIFASSSEVYGDPKENPQNESYNGNVNTTGLRSIYDEGKRFGEALAMSFHREFNLKTHLVRIFNTYGEQMRLNDGRVIPNFIMQALKNEPLTIHGDGSQTRSIQYVSDLVDGVLKLAQTDIFEPINIGNPIEMTVKEIAEKIIELTNSTSQLIYLPLPEHDPHLRCPDITKAKQMLGWEPKVNPEEGLKRTIAWFKTAM